MDVGIFIGMYLVNASMIMTFGNVVMNSFHDKSFVMELVIIKNIAKLKIHVSQTMKHGLVMGRSFY